MAITFAISSDVQPRDKSFAGRASPAESGQAPQRRPGVRRVCSRCFPSRDREISAHWRGLQQANRGFASCDRGDERSISLQFAVDREIGLAGFRDANASRTLSTRECDAEPLVEKERSATRGSASRNARAFSAVASAISASSCAVGSGTTAQSAKSIAPFSPKLALLSVPLLLSSRCRVIIRKKLETRRASGASPIECKAARTVSDVGFAAPPTVESASPAATLSAAK